jgi:hypothetical protein
LTPAQPRGSSLSIIRTFDDFRASCILRSRALEGPKRPRGSRGALPHHFSPTESRIEPKGRPGRQRAFEGMRLTYDEQRLVSGGRSRHALAEPEQTRYEARSEKVARQIAGVAPFYARNTDVDASTAVLRSKIGLKRQRFVFLTQRTRSSAVRSHDVIEQTRFDGFGSSFTLEDSASPRGHPLFYNRNTRIFRLESCVTLVHRGFVREEQSFYACKRRLEAVGSCFLGVERRGEPFQRRLFVFTSRRDGVSSTIYEVTSSVSADGRRFYE